MPWIIIIPGIVFMGSIGFPLLMIGFWLIIFKMPDWVSWAAGISAAAWYLHKKEKERKKRLKMTDTSGIINVCDMSLSDLPAAIGADDRKQAIDYILASGQNGGYHGFSNHIGSDDS